MKEFIAAIDTETGEPIVECFSALERFSYNNGYLLEGIDLGMYAGVKLVMTHEQYDTATILLDNETAEKLAFWLLKTMGQDVPLLPNKLPITLRGILDQKGYNIKLKRGDRKVIERTMAILRDVLYHEEAKKKKCNPYPDRRKKK